jgi:hypothetical protein
MSMFEQTLLKSTLEAISIEMEQSILSYNDRASNFKFEYEVKGDYIFCLGYSKVEGNQCTDGIYRMETASVYGDRNLYKNGNAIDYSSMYKVSDVIQQTKSYFNHVAKKLNDIIE